MDTFAVEGSIYVYMCVFVCKDVCVCTCVKRKRTGVRKGKGGKLRRKGWIEIERKHKEKETIVF